MTTPPSPSSAKFLQRLEQYLLKLKNNKYAIRTVSDIIRERPQLSSDITKLVVERILHTQPDNRVPLLYVMDALCKTCDASFKDLFSPHIENIILSTLGKSTPKARESILHMIDTWRASHTFPVGILERLTPPSTSGHKRAREVTNRTTSRQDNTQDDINPVLWNHLMDGIEYIHKCNKQVNVNVNGPRMLLIAQDALSFYKSGKSPIPPLQALDMCVREVGKVNPELLTRDPIGRGFVNSFQQLMRSFGMRPPPLPLPNINSNSNSNSNSNISLGTNNSNSNSNSKTTNPNFSFSSTALLQRANPFALSMLYDKLPQQCEFCALRFPDSELIAGHLDWHFKENLKLTKSKDGGASSSSRHWYLESGQWERGMERDDTGIPYDGDAGAGSVPDFLQGDASSTSNGKEVDKGGMGGGSVVADERQTSCPICNEKFDQYWDDNQDDWMYRDAMMGQLPGKEKEKEGDGEVIVHPSCFLDVGQ